MQSEPFKGEFSAGIEMTAVCTLHRRPGVYRCAKCKCAVYCSPACQRSGWLQGHRESCGGFQRVNPPILMNSFFYRRGLAVVTDLCSSLPGSIVVSSQTDPLIGCTVIFKYAKDRPKSHIGCLHLPARQGSSLIEYYIVSGKEILTMVHHLRDILLEDARAPEDVPTVRRRIHPGQDRDGHERGNDGGGDDHGYVDDIIHITWLCILLVLLNQRTIFRPTDGSRYTPMRLGRATFSFGFSVSFIWSLFCLCSSYRTLFLWRCRSSCCKSLRMCSYRS